MILSLYFSKTQNRFLYVVSVHMMMNNENIVVINLFLTFQTNF